MSTLDRLVQKILPDRYSAGELPGESLLGEAVRRGSFRLVPNRVLRRVWDRLLLGDDGVWCFILGVNNSGTTLLHDLLARHPDVRALPQMDLVAAEGQWHTAAIPVAGDHGVPRLFTNELDAFRWRETDAAGQALEVLHDWGFQLLRHSRPVLSGSVLLEKSPPSALRGRWLQAHFSRPRFIAMVRHPCAVAEGIRRREGYDVRRAARHWATANSILLDDLTHLDEWIPVRYEQLCRDPGGTLARLVDFLDLPGHFDASDLTGLDVHSLDQSVETVQNFNPRSFERLSSTDMAAIASEVERIADRLSYEVPPRGYGPDDA